MPRFAPRGPDTKVRSVTETEMFFSTQCQGRLWGPSNRLSYVCMGLFYGVQQRRYEVSFKLSQ